MDITFQRDWIVLDPSKICSSEIDYRKSSKIRASYYFIGALLSKFKEVTIGYPGGDNFGSRPIDQHIKGLEAMGAQFTFYKDYYTVKADKLSGADIYFDVVTSGATINLILAAALADGKTILRNAAKDPEVVDIAIFLNKMGANIKGAGTDTIVIDGVDRLSGCSHTVIPDRLTAGAFFMAAGITGGDITVKNIIPSHLHSCISKLEESGMTFEIGDNYIRAISPKVLKGINTKTGMYPAFATDFQQPLTAMLVGAESHSVVTELVFPGRFNHCIQLNRMGADIIIKEGSVVIPGQRSLTGAWVHASDVRAGTCLILAGLAAEGTTYITGVEHIERGYVDIVGDLTLLGADITMHEDADEGILDNAAAIENLSV
jgi:UDP-N-acetylglucosamine 1-carboxyvinyltransferase